VSKETYYSVKRDLQCPKIYMTSSFAKAELPAFGNSFAKAELRAKRERGRCGGVGGERERESEEGGREGERRGGEGDRKKARTRAASESKA
jgi:hypothetical protein